MRRRSTRRGVRPTGRLLDVAAVCGTIGLAGVVAAIVFGLTPLIVVGSSMEPSIPLGSLVVTRHVPAIEARVGDVVSVERANGTRVTHRVIDTAVVESALTELTLRGDANPSADATRPVVAGVDRVEWVIPGAGSALRWLRSPLVAFVLGMGAALALWSSVAARHRPVAAVMWTDGLPHRLAAS